MEFHWLRFFVINLSISFTCLGHFDIRVFHCSSSASFMDWSHTYFPFHKFHKCWINTLNLTMIGINYASGSYCDAMNYKIVLFVNFLFDHGFGVNCMVSMSWFHINPKKLSFFIPFKSSSGIRLLNSFIDASLKISLVL